MIHPSTGRISATLQHQLRPIYLWQQAKSVLAGRIQKPHNWRWKYVDNLITLSAFDAIWRKMHHLQLENTELLAADIYSLVCLNACTVAKKRWFSGSYHIYTCALVMSKMTVRKTMNSGPACACKLDRYELARETCWQVDFSCFMYMSIPHTQVDPTLNADTRQLFSVLPPTTRSIILCAYMPPYMPPSSNLLIPAWSVHLLTKPVSFQTLLISSCSCVSASLYLCIMCWLKLTSVCAGLTAILYEYTQTTSIQIQNHGNKDYEMQNLLNMKL